MAGGTRAYRSTVNQTYNPTGDVSKPFIGLWLVVLRSGACVLIHLIFFYARICVTRFSGICSCLSVSFHLWSPGYCMFFPCFQLVTVWCLEEKERLDVIDKTPSQVTG